MFSVLQTTGGVHKFDWEYAYDALDRLTTADRGNWTGSDIDTETDQEIRRWTLDQAGNFEDMIWDLNTNGTYDAGEFFDDRVFNVANELTARDYDNNGGAADNTLYTLAYDGNGNLTSDDKLYDYNYDAWNRLVEIDETGTSNPVAEFECRERFGEVTRAYTRAHTRTHTRTHTCTHTRAHTREIQQGDHLLDAERFAHVRRQDLRAEPFALGGWSPIVHAWVGDLDGPDPGEDRSARHVPVADHLAVPPGVGVVSVPLDAAGDLGLDGVGDQIAGPATDRVGRASAVGAWAVGTSAIETSAVGSAGKLIMFVVGV